MNKSALLFLAVMAFSVLQITSGCCPKPGVCFVWNDNGTSDCVACKSEDECEKIMKNGKWQRKKFINVCTIPKKDRAKNAKVECRQSTRDNLPVVGPVAQDARDPNADKNAKLDWRFVVVVDACESDEKKCVEQHRLMKCQSDGTGNCFEATVVPTEYNGGKDKTEPWTVTYGPGFKCKDVSAEYKGCHLQNFHFWSRCVKE